MKENGSRLGRFALIAIFALLMTLSPSGPGGVLVPEPWLETVKLAARLTTYGIVAALALFAVFRIAATGELGRPGILVWVFCTFYLYASMKFLFFGHVAAGLQYVAVAVTYLIVFGIFLTKVPERTFGIREVLVAAAISNIAIVLSNLPLALGGIGYSYTIRFVGLSYNPNQLAYSLAITSCCLPFLAKAFSFKLPVYIIMVALYLANGILIVSTLSRGASVLLMFSAIFAVYMLSRALFIAALVALPGAVVAFFAYFTNSFLYIRLFAQRENTRFWVWQEQFQTYQQFPFFGEAWIDDSIRYGENLFLGALSQLGIIGLPIALLMVFPRLFQFVWAGWLTLRFGPERRIEYQTAAAFMGLTLLSTVLEGMLMGVTNHIIFAYMLFDAAAAKTRTRQA